MVGRHRVVNPGPEDESLLYLQSRHVSQAVWLGHDDRILKLRRVAHGDRLFDPPLAIVPYLRQAGFYGVARLGQFDFNPALVSALVERWRPETHTFHTTWGECTITLQDVAVQLGLPCEGLPVCGQTNHNWPGLCQSLLGITPPQKTLDGQRLSVTWLAQNFAQLLDDAEEEDVKRFARAYIMRLIGGHLMPDRTGHWVSLMYLTLLDDFAVAGQYSWGSAVLAFLYREMCNATHYEEVNIGGCLTLLHLWAWDRFPMLAPERPPQPNPRLDVYPVRPPLGFRWKRGGQHIRPPAKALQQYRVLLDQMGDDEIIWLPYESPSVRELIPEYCMTSQNIWLASVPIICFHIVEWHHADRVLCQFGRQQPIPNSPFNLGPCHTIQLRGKTMKDWRQEHAVFITAWNEWRNTLSQTEMSSEPIDRTSEYMRWYWKCTRRWIHPASGAQGFVVDVAENLYRLSMIDPPPLDYSKFRESVARDCSAILRALGEHREMKISQPAPPAPELPRPPAPEGRSGKRGNGYLSTRNPIVDDED